MKTYAPITSLVTTKDGNCPEGYVEIETVIGNGGLQAINRQILGELRWLEDEADVMHKLISRQGRLLAGVVNALRGTPPEDTLWSHHDAPDLAKTAADALRSIRDFRAEENEWDACDRVLPEIRKIAREGLPQ